MTTESEQNLIKREDLLKENKRNEEDGEISPEMVNALKSINYKDPKEWSLTTVMAIFDYLEKITPEQKKENDENEYELVFKSAAEYIKQHAGDKEINKSISDYWSKAKSIIYRHDDTEGIMKHRNEHIKIIKKELYNKFPQEFINILNKISEKGESLLELADKDFNATLEEIKKQLEYIFDDIESQLKNSCPDYESFRYYRREEGRKNFFKYVLKKYEIKEDERNENIHNTYHVMGTAYSEIFYAIQNAFIYTKEDIFKELNRIKRLLINIKYKESEDEEWNRLENDIENFIKEIKEFRKQYIDSSLSTS